MMAIAISDAKHSGRVYRRSPHSPATHLQTLEHNIMLHCARGHWTVHPIYHKQRFTHVESLTDIHRITWPGGFVGVWLSEAVGVCGSVVCGIYGCVVQEDRRCAWFISRPTKSRCVGLLLKCSKHKNALECVRTPWSV